MECESLGICNLTLEIVNDGPPESVVRMEANLLWRAALIDDGGAAGRVVGEGVRSGG
jgi:hypothetical protein